MRKSYAKVKNLKNLQRIKRRLSIRKKISGTDLRPRVCPVKSNQHITVQLIDDVNSRSLFTVSTFGKNKVDAGCNIEGAKLVGTKIAEKLKERKIDSVVFDRAGYKYTGVIAALVQGIRDSGIKV